MTRLKMKRKVARTTVARAQKAPSTIAAAISRGTIVMVDSDTRLIAARTALRTSVRDTCWLFSAVVRTCSSCWARRNADVHRRHSMLMREGSGGCWAKRPKCSASLVAAVEHSRPGNWVPSNGRGLGAADALRLRHRPLTVRAFT